jgi:hypothetical protein
MGLVAALAVSACASEPVAVARWSKPGGTEAAFVAIRGQCVNNVRRESAAFYVAGQRGSGTGGVFAELFTDIGADFNDPTPADRPLDNDMFHRCMNLHGWSVDPKGFAPPEDDEVPLSN